MYTPIDNTEFLNNVHQVQEINNALLARLEAHLVTPTQRETFKLIKTAVNLNTGVIQNLTERYLNLLDLVEDTVRSNEAKKDL